MKIKNIYSYLISLPKTLYFNFKYLNFSIAIKLPIIVSHKVVLLNTKGKIQINSNNIKFGMVKIGYGDVPIFDQKKSRSIWNVFGKVVFNGTCNIGHGSKICINKNGKLTFGNNFTITAESSIVCRKEINFGDDCLISWDNLIMDSDFHKIFDTNDMLLNEDNKIVIGNNVWIGCRTTILKGTTIPNNAVIAANSCVYKNFSKENTIIGGNPAKVIKENISWKI